MVYTYIEQIPKKHILFYIGLFSVVMYIINTMMTISLGHILGLSVGVFLIYFFNEKDIKDTSDLNTELEYKLNAIKNKTLGTKIDRHRKRNLTGRLDKSPLYFHNDADIINLMYNIIDFAHYNEDAYFLMIKAIDNVILLHENIKTGVTRCTENIETMVIFRDNALNHFHSFIFSLPSIKVINDKYKKNMKRLQLLLQRHIDSAVRICRSQNYIRGIDVDTKFIDPGHVFLNAPKANRMDDRSFSRFDFY